MPTPSDGTPMLDRTHEEMVQQGQAALDEAARAVEEQKAQHEAVTQAFIPNRGVPPVSGDCILDGGEY